MGEGEEEVARRFPVQGEEGTRSGARGGSWARRRREAEARGRAAGGRSANARERGGREMARLAGCPSGPRLGRIRPGRVIRVLFCFSFFVFYYKYK